MGERIYRVVAVGGTFDHLHAGHEALLSKAFEVGKIVLIGVSSDDFVRRLGKSVDRPYEERVRGLKAYLDANFPDRGYEIAPLDDYFGPRMYDEDVEAIVVSEETAGRVDSVNRVRLDKGLKPLEVIVVGMVLAEDGRPISSTRIRWGEIDREGRLLKGGSDKA